MRRGSNGLRRFLQKRHSRHFVRFEILTLFLAFETGIRGDRRRRHFCEFARVVEHPVWES